jgi:hypothetical protein
MNQAMRGAAMVNLSKEKEGRLPGLTRPIHSQQVSVLAPLFTFAQNRSMTEALHPKARTTLR